MHPPTQRTRSRPPHLVAPRQQALAQLVDVALHTAGVGVEEVGHHEEAQLLWWRVVAAHGGTRAAAAATRRRGVVRRSPLVSRCTMSRGELQQRVCSRSGPCKRQQARCKLEHLLAAARPHAE